MFRRNENPSWATGEPGGLKHTAAQKVAMCSISLWTLTVPQLPKPRLAPQLCLVDTATVLSGPVGSWHCPSWSHTVLLGPHPPMGDASKMTSSAVLHWQGVNVKQHLSFYSLQALLTVSRHSAACKQEHMDLWACPIMLQSGTASTKCAKRGCAHCGEGDFMARHSTQVWAATCSISTVRNICSQKGQFGS